MSERRRRRRKVLTRKYRLHRDYDGNRRIVYGGIEVAENRTDYIFNIWTGTVEPCAPMRLKNGGWVHLQ